MIKEIKQCRACGCQDFIERVSLPSIYPSIFTNSSEPLEGWPKVPLDLIECERCRLVQLMHSFEPDQMYRQYWYQSSINKTMVAALRDVVICAAEIANPEPGDVVLDIGCNDGTLLKMWGEVAPGVRRIGFDPANNLSEKASSNCERFVNDYFKAGDEAEKAKVITAIAMFYDLEDVPEFIESVLAWLKSDGIFIIQMTDLASMIRLNAFDNICHEHLEYWSLWSLQNILNDFGLEVFHVSQNEVNGGSLRAYISRKGVYPVRDSVYEYERDETDPISHKWKEFELSIYKTCSALKSLCATMRAFGKLVGGLGASTKGNTLLQVANLNALDILEIGEVSEAKFGKYTVGTGIPIVNEGVLLEHDAYIVLPWHFAATFSNYGSKLVFPLPQFKAFGEIVTL